MAIIGTLVNSGCCWRMQKRLYEGAKAANLDTRTLGISSPLSQDTSRETFMATAVRTCCKWVFARPIYLVVFKPKT